MSEEQNEDYVLELTTAVVPGKKFTVDGDEYLMKNPDHMSEEDESRVMGKFAIHGRLARQLDMASAEPEARKIAVKLRDSRIGLITELTSLPKDVATQLPMSAQAALLQQVQKEMGVGDEPE